MTTAYQRFRDLVQQVSQAGPPRSVLFICMHKGGSTFVADHLAPALDDVLEEMSSDSLGARIVGGEDLSRFSFEPRGRVYVRVYPPQLYQRWRSARQMRRALRPLRRVCLLRDPRDVMVSHFYSVAFSHDEAGVAPRNREYFRRLRETLRELSPREGIKRLLIEKAEKRYGPIDEFEQIMAFSEQLPDSLLVKYETMVLDFPGWLASVGSYLRWSANVIQTLEEGLADELKPPEQEDPNAHKRRMLPGNWREVFDEELCEMVRQRIGSTMERAGYLW